MLTFDPNRPAQEMTCAELMSAHVAMSRSSYEGLTGEAIVKQVSDIYYALNRRTWGEEAVEESADE